MLATSKDKKTHIRGSVEQRAVFHGPPFTVSDLEPVAEGVHRLRVDIGYMVIFNDRMYYGYSPCMRVVTDGRTVDTYFLDRDHGLTSLVEDRGDRIFYMASFYTTAPRIPNQEYITTRIEKVHSFFSQYVLQNGAMSYDEDEYFLVLVLTALSSIGLLYDADVKDILSNATFMQFLNIVRDDNNSPLGVDPEQHTHGKMLIGKLRRLNINNFANQRMNDVQFGDVKKIISNVFEKFCMDVLTHIDIHIKSANVISQSSLEEALSYLRVHRDTEPTMQLYPIPASRMGNPQYVARLVTSTEDWCMLKTTENDCTRPCMWDKEIKQCFPPLPGVLSSVGSKKLPLQLLAEIEKQPASRPILMLNENADQVTGVSDRFAMPGPSIKKNSNTEIYDKMISHSFPGSVFSCLSSDTAKLSTLNDPTKSILTFRDDVFTRKKKVLNYIQVPLKIKGNNDISIEFNWRALLRSCVHLQDVKKMFVQELMKNIPSEGIDKIIQLLLEYSLPQSELLRLDLKLQIMTSVQAKMRNKKKKIYNFSYFGHNPSHTEVLDVAYWCGVTQVLKMLGEYGGMKKKFPGTINMLASISDGPELDYLIRQCENSKSTLQATPNLLFPSLRTVTFTYFLDAHDKIVKTINRAKASGANIQTFEANWEKPMLDPLAHTGMLVVFGELLKILIPSKATKNMKMFYEYIVGDLIDKNTQLPDRIYRNPRVFQFFYFIQYARDYITQETRLKLPSKLKTFQEYLTPVVFDKHTTDLTQFFCSRWFDFTKIGRTFPLLELFGPGKAVQNSLVTHLVAKYGSGSKNYWFEGGLLWYVEPQKTTYNNGIELGVCVSDKFIEAPLFDHLYKPLVDLHTGSLDLNSGGCVDVKEKLPRAIGDGIFLMGPAGSGFYHVKLVSYYEATRSNLTITTSSEARKKLKTDEPEEEEVQNTLFDIQRALFGTEVLFNYSNSKEASFLQLASQEYDALVGLGTGHTELRKFAMDQCDAVSSSFGDERKKKQYEYVFGYEKEYNPDFFLRGAGDDTKAKATEDLKIGINRLVDMALAVDCLPQSRKTTPFVVFSDPKQFYVDILSGLGDFIPPANKIANYNLCLAPRELLKKRAEIAWIQNISTPDHSSSPLSFYMYLMLRSYADTVVRERFDEIASLGDEIQFFAQYMTDIFCIPFYSYDNLSAQPLILDMSSLATMKTFKWLKGIIQAHDAVNNPVNIVHSVHDADSKFSKVYWSENFLYETTRRVEEEYEKKSSVLSGSGRQLRNKVSNYVFFERTVAVKGDLDELSFSPEISTNRGQFPGKRAFFYDPLDVIKILLSKLIIVENDASPGNEYRYMVFKPNPPVTNTSLMMYLTNYMTAPLGHDPSTELIAERPDLVYDALPLACTIQEIADVMTSCTFPRVDEGELRRSKQYDIQAATDRATKFISFYFAASDHYRNNITSREDFFRVLKTTTFPGGNSDHGQHIVDGFKEFVIGQFWDDSETIVGDTTVTCYDYIIEEAQERVKKYFVKLNGSSTDVTDWIKLLNSTALQNFEAHYKFIHGERDRICSLMNRIDVKLLWFRLMRRPHCSIEQMCTLIQETLNLPYSDMNKIKDRVCCGVNMSAQKATQKFLQQTQVPELSFVYEPEVEIVYLIKNPSEIRKLRAKMYDREILTASQRAPCFTESPLGYDGANIYDYIAESGTISNEIIDIFENNRGVDINRKRVLANQYPQHFVLLDSTKTHPMFFPQEGDVAGGWALYVKLPSFFADAERLRRVIAVDENYDGIMVCERYLIRDRHINLGAVGRSVFRATVPVEILDCRCSADDIGGGTDNLKDPSPWCDPKATYSVCMFDNETLLRHFDDPQNSMVFGDDSTSMSPQDMYKTAIPGLVFKTRGVIMPPKLTECPSAWFASVISSVFDDAPTSVTQTSLKQTKVSLVQFLGPLSYDVPYSIFAELNSALMYEALAAFKSHTPLVRDAQVFRSARTSRDKDSEHLAWIRPVPASVDYDKTEMLEFPLIDEDPRTSAENIVEYVSHVTPRGDIEGMEVSDAAYGDERKITVVHKLKNVSIEKGDHIFLAGGKDKIRGVVTGTDKPLKNQVAVTFTSLPLEFDSDRTKMDKIAEFEHLLENFNDLALLIDPEYNGTETEKTGRQYTDALSHAFIDEKKLEKAYAIVPRLGCTGVDGRSSLDISFGRNPSTVDRLAPLCELFGSEIPFHHHELNLSTMPSNNMFSFYQADEYWEVNEVKLKLETDNHKRFLGVASGGILRKVALEGQAYQFILSLSLPTVSSNIQSHPLQTWSQRKLHVTTGIRDWAQVDKTPLSHLWTSITNPSAIDKGEASLLSARDVTVYATKPKKIVSAQRAAIDSFFSKTNIVLKKRLPNEHGSEDDTTRRRDALSVLDPKWLLGGNVGKGDTILVNTDSPTRNFILDFVNTTNESPRTSRLFLEPQDLLLRSALSSDPNVHMQFRLAMHLCNVRIFSMWLPNGVFLNMRDLMKTHLDNCISRNQNVNSDASRDLFLRLVLGPVIQANKSHSGRMKSTDDRLIVDVMTTLVLPFATTGYSKEMIALKNTVDAKQTVTQQVLRGLLSLYCPSIDIDSLAIARLKHKLIFRPFEDARVQYLTHLGFLKFLEVYLESDPFDYNGVLKRATDNRSTEEVRGAAKKEMHAHIQRVWEIKKAHTSYSTEEYTMMALSGKLSADNSDFFYCKDHPYRLPEQMTEKVYEDTLEFISAGNRNFAMNLIGDLLERRAQQNNASGALKNSRTVVLTFMQYCTVYFAGQWNTILRTLMRGVKQVDSSDFVKRLTSTYETQYFLDRYENYDLTQEINTTDNNKTKVYKLYYAYKNYVLWCSQLDFLRPASELNAKAIEKTEVNKSQESVYVDTFASRVNPLWFCQYLYLSKLSNIPVDAGLEWDCEFGAVEHMLAQRAAEHAYRATRNSAKSALALSRRSFSDWLPVMFELRPGVLPFINLGGMTSPKDERYQRELGGFSDHLVGRPLLENGKTRLGLLSSGDDQNYAVVKHCFFEPQKSDALLDLTKWAIRTSFSAIVTDSQEDDDVAIVTRHYNIKLYSQDDNVLLAVAHVDVVNGRGDRDAVLLKDMTPAGKNATENYTAPIQLKYTIDSEERNCTLEPSSVFERIESILQTEANSVSLGTALAEQKRIDTEIFRDENMLVQDAYNLFDFSVNATWLDRGIPQMCYSYFVESLPFLNIMSRQKEIRSVQKKASDELRYFFRAIFSREVDAFFTKVLKADQIRLWHNRKFLFQSGLVNGQAMKHVKKIYDIDLVPMLVSANYDTIVAKLIKDSTHFKHMGLSKRHFMSNTVKKYIAAQILRRRLAMKNVTDTKTKLAKAFGLKLQDLESTLSLSASAANSSSASRRAAPAQDSAMASSDPLTPEKARAIWDTASRYLNLDPGAALGASGTVSEIQFNPDPDTSLNIPQSCDPRSVGRYIVLGSPQQSLIVPNDNSLVVVFLGFYQDGLRSLLRESSCALSKTSDDCLRNPDGCSWVLCNSSCVPAPNDLSQTRMLYRATVKSGSSSSNKPNEIHVFQTRNEQSHAVFFVCQRSPAFEPKSPFKRPLPPSPALKKKNKKQSTPPAQLKAKNKRIPPPEQKNEKRVKSAPPTPIPKLPATEIVFLDAIHPSVPSNFELHCYKGTVDLHSNDIGSTVRDLLIRLGLIKYPSKRKNYSDPAYYEYGPPHKDMDAWRDAHENLRGKTVPIYADRFIIRIVYDETLNARRLQIGARLYAQNGSAPKRVYVLMVTHDRYNEKKSALKKHEQQIIDMMWSGNGDKEVLNRNLQRITCGKLSQFETFDGARTLPPTPPGKTSLPSLASSSGRSREYPYHWEEQYDNYCGFQALTIALCRNAKTEDSKTLRQQARTALEKVQQRENVFLAGAMPTTSVCSQVNAEHLSLAMKDLGLAFVQFSCDTDNNNCGNFPEVLASWVARSGVSLQESQSQTARSGVFIDKHYRAEEAPIPDKWDGSDFVRGLDTFKDMAVNFWDENFIGMLMHNTFVKTVGTTTVLVPHWTFVTCLEREGRLDWYYLDTVESQARGSFPKNPLSVDEMADDFKRISEKKDVSRISSVFLLMNKNHP